MLSESHNISPEEYLALKNLARLVFKNADKDNAIVVTDKTECLNKTLHHFGDERYYTDILEPFFSLTL